MGIFILVFGGMGFIFLIVAYICGKRDKKQKMESQKVADKKYREEANNEANRKKLKIIESIENNTFEFPCLDFYKLCVENSIADTNDDFSKQKRIVLVNQILKKAGVPDFCWPEFHPRAIEYYKKGMEIVNERNKIPQKGELTENEKALWDFNFRYSQHSGIQKSRRILDDRIDEIKKKIQGLIEGEKALKTLGSIYATSYSTMDKRDWSIEGGIASGLGGSVAGAAAAADAMAYNAKAYAYNEANRKKAYSLAMDMYSGSSKMGRTRSELYNQQHLLEHQKDTLESKVLIDNIPQDKLAEALEISYQKVSSGEKHTDISFSVDNKYSMDYPEGTHIAIDGSFNVKILCDKDTVIDTINVALPLYGIELGHKESLKGITPFHMDGDHEKYRIEIKPNKLWVVEM